MWEAIARNRSRSHLLIAAMGVLLVVLGFAIGMAIDPQRGGAIGALVACLVWLILWSVALFSGAGVLLSASGAHEIKKEDAPQLWNIVEEMTIAAGLPKVPAIYLVEDIEPNAFAVGQRPDAASITVTSGLVRILTRDELQGVIAHEIGHIRNLDIRFMTTAGVMVGAITLIADVFLRGVFYSDNRRRSSRDGNNNSNVLMLCIALAVAILAPLCARLLYLACSREREYLADASSARFTRYPLGLASALQKIALRAPADVEANRVIAPMYIVNPLQSMSEAGLFSTHPPTEKRIAILRAMSGHAGLPDYEAAYQKLNGNSLLGARTLQGEPSLAARPPLANSAPPDPIAEEDDTITRAREIHALLGRAGQFVSIPCDCGMTIKVPPDYTRPTIQCPRCGLMHTVPKAAPLASLAPLAAAANLTQVASNPSVAQPAQLAPAPLTAYPRAHPGEWESFRCSCGQTIQLSPLFNGNQVRCPKCHTEIEITTPPAAG